MATEPQSRTAAVRLGFAHSRGMTSSMMDGIQPRHRAPAGAGIVVAVALAIAVPILVQCPADPLYGGGELTTSVPEGVAAGQEFEVWLHDE